MSEVEKCKSCKADMVPDPSPDMRGKHLLCIECDFRPEAIKKFVRSIFPPNPQWAIPKIEGFTPEEEEPIFEPKEEMNPYLAEVFSLVDGDESAIRDGLLFGTGFKSSMLMMMARHRYVYKYAWSIPCKAALEAIARHSPIVEIGAGSGYWAHLLANIGADIIAYDASTTNQYKGSFNSFYKPWYEVREGNEHVVKKHSDRALFLCWPPYNDEIAFNCLKKYDGNTVIYVGEGDSAGGCTASDKFFEHLEKHFVEEDYVELPVWFGIHDHLWIYKRSS